MNGRPASGRRATEPGVMAAWARRLLGRLPAALLLAVVAMTGIARPAAAVQVTFGTPSATATFGRGIEFVQPASLPDAATIARVELLIDLPRAPGPEVRVVQPAGAGVLRYLLDTSTGGLLPNTSLTGSWRVVGRDGTSTTGPSVSVRYDDTRFSWQTRQGPLMTVHWYAGGSAFGERAIQIGSAAIQKASTLLGVTETQPIDFFVYADQAAFYDALGPGTRENVGGQADSSIRTLFALITPGEIDASWVGVVIPHELTHLVFDTAVSNPYHFPPRWLNEGLAVYLAQGYGPSDRTAVERAVADGSLMPLDSLGGQFPTTRDRFTLAYAESVSAVASLVANHGQEALVRLIRSYASGVTDDEAFQAGIGMTTEAFDAAWRAGIRADPPVAYGPQPAPAGPLPPGWSALAGAPGTSVAPSSGAAVQPANPPATAPAATGPETGGTGSALVLVLAGVIGLAGLVLLLRAAGRSSDEPR